MDILAARKRAAEQAKAARQAPAAGPNAASQGSPEPERADEASLPLGDGMAAQDLTASAGEREGASGSGRSAAADAGMQAEDGQELEMLAFLLGTEEYVVPVEQVREVLKPRDITPVPHTPDYLLGVCSLRGAVLPVIDLARRMGLGAESPGEKSRIIVTGGEQEERMGLLVKGIRGVVRFPVSSVRPAPETIDRGAEFLQGIARTDERLFILLNVEEATDLRPAAV